MHRRTGKELLAPLGSVRQKTPERAHPREVLPCDLTSRKPSKLAHLLTHFHALCAVSHFVNNNIIEYAADSSSAMGYRFRHPDSQTVCIGVAEFDFVSRWRFFDSGAKFLCERMNVGNCKV